MRLRLRSDFIPGLAASELRASDRTLYSAPRFAAPAGRLRAFQVDEHGRWIDYFQWGLVPPFTGVHVTGAARELSAFKDVLKGDTFREALRTRRCVILVDGFVCWRSVGRRMLPHLVTLPDEQWFAIAGLWTMRRFTLASPPEPCCTVITAAATGPLVELTPQAPIVFDRHAIESWCNPSSDMRDATALLQPCALPFAISRYDHELV